MNFTAGSLNSKSPNYRPKYDDRKGLGYGLLEPRFHEPAWAGSTYPYREPDQYDIDDEEFFDEEELDAFVAKVNGNYQAVDSPATATGDPFAMVTGNQPIFYEQLGVATSSSSPFPNMYKKRTGGGTGGIRTMLPYPGPTAGFRTSRLGTGSKQGYSAPPPISAIAAVELDEPVNSLEQIPDDDERTLLRLRKLIAAINKESTESDQY